MQVYVASPLGFSEPTASFYTQVLLPVLRTAGIEPLDPWAGSAGIEQALAIDDLSLRLTALKGANHDLGAANARMIEEADAVLAVLDGVDIDSGTAAEIGWAAAIGRPVVGWRSDFRRAGDNEAAVVNLQVEYFIERSGGRIERSLDHVVAALLGLGQTRSRTAT